MALKRNSIISSPILRIGPGGQYTKLWPPIAAYVKTSRQNNSKIVSSCSVAGGNIYNGLDMFGQLGRFAANFALAGRYLLEIFGFKTSRRVPEFNRPSGLNAVKLTPQFMVPKYQKCRSVEIWRKTHEPGKEKNAHSARCADPQAGRSSTLDRTLPQQKWLFPDAAGNRPKTKPKPSNHLRTRRSPSPKRTARPIAQQSTLFDA